MLIPVVLVNNSDSSEEYSPSNPSGSSIPHDPSGLSDPSDSSGPSDPSHFRTASVETDYCIWLNNLVAYV